MGKGKTFGRKAALVAIALVFVMFAGRIGNWSSGFNSEFLVYGQTGGTGTGDTGTGGGTTTTSLTRVIPQIVAGVYGDQEWKSIIQITNSSSTAVTVTGNFYKQDGTASTLAYTTTSTTTPSITTGTLASTIVAANSVLVITAASTAAGTINWGRLVTTGTVSIAAFFEAKALAATQKRAVGDLIFRVGVGATSEDATSFMIPRIRNAASGSDGGFALVNTGAGAANLTATLKSATGATIAARTIALGGRNHTSDFSDIFFKLAGCAPCLTNDPVTGKTVEAAGTNYQYIVFTSTVPQFAAIGLEYEADMYTSLPVERLQ